MNYDSYCPICKQYIMRPVWLPKKYTAYCDNCQRAYTDKEILWLPEKDTPEKLAAIELAKQH